MFSLLRRKSGRDALLGAALLSVTAALMAYPAQAMEAGRAGLQLCGNVIIPSLFPFFVISSLTVDLGLAGYIGRVLEKIMQPLFRVPGACAAAVALGFVGGYPVGARTAIALYEKGMCTKTQAQRLLAFCNNSGPAFILGVVGAGVFDSSRVGVLLCLVHALASLCVGLLFRFYGREEKTSGTEKRLHFETRRLSAAFTDAVKNSFLSTLNICAFVVFFTVVIRMLDQCGVLPGAACVLSLMLAPLGVTKDWGERLLIGFLEISSGVWSLSGVHGQTARLSMAAFMLGWAGVSVHCQVLSFLGQSGLSPRTYLAGKLLHGGVSALLMGVLSRVFLPELAVNAYLTQQVEGLVELDFPTALTVSVVCAWVMWLLFFLLAAGAVRKTSGKRRKGVI